MPHQSRLDLVIIANNGGQNIVKMQVVCTFCKWMRFDSMSIFVMIDLYINQLASVYPQIACNLPFNKAGLWRAGCSTHRFSPVCLVVRWDGTRLGAGLPELSTTFGRAKARRGAGRPPESQAEGGEGMGYFDAWWDWMLGVTCWKVTFITGCSSEIS